MRILNADCHSNGKYTYLRFTLDDEIFTLEMDDETGKRFQSTTDVYCPGYDFVVWNLNVVCPTLGKSLQRLYGLGKVNPDNISGIFKDAEITLKQKWVRKGTRWFVYGHFGLRKVLFPRNRYYTHISRIRLTEEGFNLLQELCW